MTNRFLPNQLFSQSHKSKLEKLQNYNLINNTFKAKRKYLQRHQINIKPNTTWHRFSNFTNFYISNQLPFLLDFEGNLCLPFDPEQPDNLFPEKPKTIVTQWQLDVLNLQRPKGRNIVIVNDVIFKKKHHFTLPKDFNLDLFKYKLLNHYFNQILDIHLDSDLTQLKPVTHYFKEVLLLCKQNS